MFELIRDRRGAVSAIFAIVLPVALGTAGLVVEYGRGVLVKVENQRIADLSAYAGATAYNATSSQSSMVAAAQGIAAINGVPASRTTVSLVASPTGTPSINAVRVQISTTVPLLFSRLVGATASLSVPAEAYAELRPSVDSCILALSATASGVAMTGGTQLQAPACAVASNASVSVPCGTTLRSVGVAYNSAAAPSAPCGGIVGPGGGAPTITKRATPDALAGNADLATARSRVATVGAMGSPVAPAPPPAPVVATPTGTFRDIDLGYNDSATQTQATALGCTASKSGSTWTLNCGAGAHNFNNFSVGGGLTLAMVGTTATVYNFAQPLSTGPTISFGTGAFTFMRGLSIGYGGASFGAGALSIIGDLSTSSTATFGSSNVTITGNATLGSSATLSGTGTLAVGGNLTLSGASVAQSAIAVTGNFAVTTNAALTNLRTLNVGGEMLVGSSGTMSFGGGSYAITGGLTTTGSSRVTFGAGTYRIGRSSSACNGSQFSICSTAASLTFTGPSIFSLTSGISIGGGSTAALGDAGTANSFQIGAAPNGNAVQVAGGAQFRMGDAIAAASLFELGGNLNVASGGGSCTVVGAAVHHDIKGSLTTAGATVLGAGTYTVYGSVGIGANGGGNVMCNGANVGLLAQNVSLIIGANGAGLTGACSGQIFCVAAGYSSTVLTAPTAGTYRRLALVGPANAGGALFTGGSASTTLSGLVYFPGGSVRLEGAASVGNGTGECLQVIGKDVTLNGGSMLASTCISGSSTGGRVVLVK